MGLERVFLQRVRPAVRRRGLPVFLGTAIGITEYNRGAEGHINGATTQADVLGIFGREGLDLAARWTTPAATTPTYKAMKMYRNYDGNKSTFGDTSVAASVANPDSVSTFAAERSLDGALTVMAINKNLSGSSQTTVNLANFASGPAQSTPAAHERPHRRRKLSPTAWRRRVFGGSEDPPLHRAGNGAVAN